MKLTTGDSRRPSPRSTSGSREGDDERTHKKLAPKQLRTCLGAVEAAEPEPSPKNEGAGYSHARPREHPRESLQAQ